MGGGRPPLLFQHLSDQHPSTNGEEPVAADPEDTAAVDAAVDANDTAAAVGAAVDPEDPAAEVFAEALDEALKADPLGPDDAATAIAKQACVAAGIDFRTFITQQVQQLQAANAANERKSDSSSARGSGEPAPVAEFPALPGFANVEATPPGKDEVDRSSQATTLEWGVDRRKEQTRLGTSELETPIKPYGTLDQVFCMTCEAPLDVLSRGIRICGKATMPQYKCSKCNSKTVALCNMFGGWPIEEFKCLDAIAQKQFWKEAASVTDGFALRKAVEKHIVRKLITQRVNAREGEYNSLGYWASLGQDTKYIEENCASEWNSSLGCMTYKVYIHRTAERSIEEGITEHMNKLLERGKTAADRRKRVLALEGNVAEAEPEPKRRRVEAAAEEAAAAAAGAAGAVEACGSALTAANIPPNVLSKRVCLVVKGHV